MRESQGFFVILARLSCYPDAKFGIGIAAERRVAKNFECLAAPVELLNRVCAAKIGLAAQFSSRGGDGLSNCPLL
jgi:hypothetical protein